MVKRQKTATVKQLEAHELVLLRQKVTDLTLQKPEKAAKVLELWIKSKTFPRQKSVTKKAA